MLGRKPAAMLLGATVAWTALAVPALTSEESEAAQHDAVSSVAMINSWYQALAPGKPAAQMISQLDGILAADAGIEIVDLDVAQTRAEFLESVEEWHDAIDGGLIAHRIEPGFSASQVTVTACFRFTGNELMSRETFTLADGEVTSAVFETIADSCETF